MAVITENEEKNTQKSKRESNIVFKSQMFIYCKQLLGIVKSICVK